MRQSGAADIRDATVADIEQITAIYRHYVETSTSTFELVAPSSAEMSQRFETITGAGYPYLVAIRDDRVAAYAYASAYRPRPAYRFTAENSIYVGRDFIGQGIGERLLAALLDRLREKEFHSVIGIVGDPETNRASTGLHRKAGFREFGRARSIGHKFDRWLDVAYLQLLLKDSG